MIQSNYKHFNRWVHKGGFAILDQALFAGSNFAVALVLARWLPVAEYGAYAFAQSIFLFTAAIHNPLFLEPMLVFGGKKYRGELNAYAGTLLLAHLIAALPIAVGLFIAGIFIKNSVSFMAGKSLMVLTVVAPVVLLLWILRRVFYIRFEPGIASIGGFLYFSSQLFLLFFAYKNHWLSAAFAFVIMGASSLLVIFFYFIFAKPRFSFSGDMKLVSVAKSHWKYSRWAMATAAIFWLSSNIYFLVLPARFGLAAAAEFKAFLTILTPTGQVTGVLSLLIVPYLSRLRHESKVKFEASVKLFMVFFAVMGFAYFLVIAFFPRQILQLFFGGRYMESYYLLPVFGVSTVLGGFTSVMMSAVRSMERPDATFWTQLSATAIATTLGVLWTLQYGLSGAVFGSVASTLVSMLTLLFIYRGFILSPRVEK